MPRDWTRMTAADFGNEHPPDARPVLAEPDPLGTLPLFGEPLDVPQACPARFEQATLPGL